MSPSPQRLLVIDGTALAFRAFFAMPPLTDSNGRPSGALHGFITSVLRVIELESADYVVVAWDRPEPTFRHKLSKDYKANRDELDDDLRVQFPWMREAMDLLGFAQLDEVGFEADDLLASLAVQGSKDGLQVRLCANDKDLAQVVSDQVQLCPPPKRDAPISEMGPSEVEEKFGVPPEQMAEWQALVGDSSDNVQGIPGIGPKRATTLLQKYGDLDSLLERGPEEEKGKLRENIESHGDTARAALELVTLVTDIDLPNWESMRPNERNHDKLKQFCMDHSLESMARRFAEEAGVDSTSEEKEEGEQNNTYQRTDHLVDHPQALQALLDGLQSSGGFAIDTETTAIDPLRAKLVGISFSWKDGEAWYLPYNLPEPLLGPQGEDPSELLRPILANPSIPKYAQNLKYDAHVLERAGLPVSGWEFDTMIAHFLVDPISPHNLDALALRYLGLQKIPTSDIIGKGKNALTMDLVPIEDVARYACEDAEATFRLVAPLRKQLKSAGAEKLFHELEMPLACILQRMEAHGIRLDKDGLRELGKNLSGRHSQLEDRIFEIAGEPFNLNSPKQLGPILFEKLNIQELAGKKKVKRTKTGYSTNAATMEGYRGIEIVDLLMEYRHLTKLIGTYVEALPTFVHPQTGCIHTSYHQAVASTGRLSSSNPNLQNIPIRTEVGKEIRRAFIPQQDDWILVALDYSQIELRVVAHLAGDPELQQAFRDGADVHARTASLVFGVSAEDVTAEMRSRAKTINFGILYGMGPQRLARELKISFPEARAFIESYFEALPGVRNWLDETLEGAKEHGYVETFFGRRRPVPELQSEDARVRASAENVAVNTPVQGTAADLIKMAMLKVQKALDDSTLQARMILQVHDELVFDCPKQELEELIELAQTAMESVADLDVPLSVDSGFGKDWATAH
ncbi:MAG: DNA polymerase I [Planctomycetes bacterium]|nr:DNA polymerase I [Planctomycetota bacterium]